MPGDRGHLETREESLDEKRGRELAPELYRLCPRNPPSRSPQSPTDGLPTRFRTDLFPVNPCITL
jgi:hypothetical protein